MDDKKIDIQSARNLFSKVEKISFGFLNIREIKIPFLNLFFRYNDIKQANIVFQQLSENLDIENLKLSIIENGGDYLTITLLWESRSVLFSSSPDHYNKRECKQFRSGVFYGDTVKLFFFVNSEEQEIPVKASKAGTHVINLDAVYYEYIP
jgi:hypothetical protein